MSAMPCQPSASYPQRAEANDVKRKLMRRYKLSVSVYLCETCDHFHLMKSTRVNIAERPMIVLKMLAQGFQREEIARETGISANSVKWYTCELIHQFSALNTAHLVATVIALGILNPNDFVPALTERDHA